MENDFQKEADGLFEILAALEHGRWSRWHEHAASNWTLENIERWNRLAKMRYDELPEFSKDSDRKEVREYFGYILEALRAAHEAGRRENEQLKAEIELYKFSIKELREKIAGLEIPDAGKKVDV